MFHSNESNKTFKLVNKTVYKLESIKFSTFKYKHGEKVNTNTSCVSKKLQIN